MKYVENDKEQIKSAVHNGVLDDERMDEEKSWRGKRSYLTNWIKKGMSVS